MQEKDLRRLLNEMSLMEKLGELQQIPGQFFKQDLMATGENKRIEFPQDVVDTVGSVINVREPEHILAVQKMHIERHPHHIPMLFMLDIIHGLHTTFPVPLAQACSFDPEMIEELSKAAAKEASVCGLHVTFSPMADLCRDARWGRVMESYGEDPYLNSVMSVAAVKGYQGEDLTKEGTISACVKHFAAYGAVEGGREYGSVDISERSLRNYYLPAYKAACDAGSGMLMCAFNAIGGVPATADKYLMKDVLRDEWGYDGAIITDYNSLTLMQSHGISDSDEVLSKLALEATVSIEMCIVRFANGLKSLLEKGEITMDQIDEAVWRVLVLKNKLGLFENPYRFVDPVKAKEIIRSEEILKIARKSVSKSSVLLKNEDNILPLNRKEKIAFIGPYLTEENILGGWSPYNYTYDDLTIEQAIKARYSNADFLFEEGSLVIGAEQPEVKIRKLRRVESDPIARKEKIARAVEAAKKADTVVMFLGEHVGLGGELQSKVFLEIPKIQQELFDAVSAVNENVVVVLFNHRPLDLREISAKSKAILDVWFPGTMGAEAIVDMLFGDTAPTGRLTMSFPYSVGQCPIYYNMLPTDHAVDYVTYYVTGYVDCPYEPLYSFGEGLTYTEFEYGEIKLDKADLREGEALTASVTVKNIGERDGCETVQLYIRDVFASISRPVKELKGFKRVEIKAGETAEVKFTLTPDDLRFYNTELDYVWEPGEIKVYIGRDSRCTDFKSFNLV